MILQLLSLCFHIGYVYTGLVFTVFLLHFMLTLFSHICSCLSAFLCILLKTGSSCDTLSSLAICCPLSVLVDCPTVSTLRKYCGYKVTVYLNLWLSFPVFLPYALPYKTKFFAVPNIAICGPWASIRLAYIKICSLVTLLMFLFWI